VTYTTISLYSEITPKVVTLSAIRMSVKPGGSARAIDIEGGVTTNGHGNSTCRAARHRRHS